MRKLIILILALAAVRLLPRALRREPMAMRLIAAIWMQASVMVAMAAGTANTAMTYNTAQRTTALETRTGTMQSQQGTTTGFSNLVQTETGSPQAGGAAYDTSSAVTGGATIQTGNPNGATISGSSVAAHTHGYGHIHDISHFHFNQMAGDFNNLVAGLNTLRNSLIAANIL